MWVPPIDRDQPFRAVRQPIPKNVDYFSRMFTLFYSRQPVPVQQYPIQLKTAVQRLIQRVGPLQDQQKVIDEALYPFLVETAQIFKPFIINKDVILDGKKLNPLIAELADARKYVFDEEDTRASRPLLAQTATWDLVYNQEEQRQ